MKQAASFLLLFIFAGTGKAQQAPLSAEHILKEACQQAAQENKNVFILFHASWCGWCHKMDSAMNDASVKAFFEKNYVIRHLVVYESPKNRTLENPGALELLTRYGGNDEGIPYWLIFDKNGLLLADSKIRPEGAGPEAKGTNTGCPATKEEVHYFINVLRKTATLTEKELALIERRFRSNEQ